MSLRQDCLRCMPESWVMEKKKPGFCGKTNLGFVEKPEFREKLGGFCGEKNLGFFEKKY